MNTLATADRIAALDTAGLRAQRATYTNAEPRDLRGIAAVDRRWRCS